MESPAPSGGSEKRRTVKGRNMDSEKQESTMTRRLTAITSRGSGVTGGTGERVNDVHLSTEEKQEVRRRTEGRR